MSGEPWSKIDPKEQAAIRRREDARCEKLRLEEEYRKGRVWTRLFLAEPNSTTQVNGEFEDGQVEVVATLDPIRASELIARYNAAGASQPARPASEGKPTVVDTTIIQRPSTLPGAGRDFPRAHIHRACDCRRNAVTDEHLPTCAIHTASPGAGKGGTQAATQEFIEAAQALDDELMLLAQQGEARQKPDLFILARLRRARAALSASPPANPAEPTRAGEAACCQLLGKLIGPDGERPRRVGAVIEAAKAVIAQWDTPNWKLVEPTAAKINTLRSALAALEVPSDGK